MAIQKLAIKDFLALAKTVPVLDVRSPGEFNHAHIPGAFGFPLFTDEERKVVGTAYKQQSRQTAIKIGLDYFGVKMRSMVEEAEKIVATYQKNHSDYTTGICVHCWRGGMRSAGVAWLLDLYGFKVYTLVGGYKAYRKWVREQFDKSHVLTIVGGYTGSGKTGVLQELKTKGRTIIDLEKMAKHKGSAFGSLDRNEQPTQEMFENLLGQELNRLENSLNQHAFIEDESQRIGLLKIPDAVWNNMRISRVCFLEIPFEQRLEYIIQEYSSFDKEKLVNAIIRIQKRLGGLETKTAIGYLVEDNYKECFRILLKYYDKLYNKALHNRENLQSLLETIPCDNVDMQLNAEKILNSIIFNNAEKINS